ncbi:alpha/beta hydrolase [Nocardiopsis sp. RSe5-2]|uniref:Alpha/beta hydrolase n=1 Tax=Nocardiopsis endophytica TaxID=3018445 RepID=A0ABT4TZA3_9ACTN|nr:alpha/beta hydrolase [Nocardiopsis endophytica]MDA2810029.1 alpha/beta hydrolase [Nocardiopsis endophytica]
MSTPRFLELPPGVRRADVTTDMGTFAALRALPTSGGCEHRPAVLVPGLTGSKEDFIGLLQTLAQAGRQVVAVDLPGQYESPGPDDFDGYGTAWLGRSVAALTAALGEGPVHLLGHSYGGLVTRETVLSGEAELLSFTLMSSGPAAVPSQGRVDDAQRLIGYLGGDPTPERLAELWERFLDAPARSSGLAEDILAFLRTRMLANSPRGLVRMCEEILSAGDRTAELAATDLPKMVLYGENDDAWPPDLQAAMADKLSARKVVVPGAAHSPNVEAPETTASALTRFWNTVETPARDNL